MLISAAHQREPPYTYTWLLLSELPDSSFSTEHGADLLALLSRFSLKGFPGGSDGKESAHSAGDPGSEVLSSHVFLYIVVQW